MTVKMCNAKAILLVCLSALAVMSMTTSTFSIVVLGKRCPLTRGWDNFNEPLRTGEVGWKVTDGNMLQVTFQLKGARPNHTYTAGAHLFNPSHKLDGFLGYDLGDPTINGFLGYSLGDHAESVRREGKTALVLSYDFGKLTTDHRGDCTVQFTGRIPPGDYRPQFTVRIGECLPSKGITKGCACVYRTGNRFGRSLEMIEVSSSSSHHSCELTRGWDIFNEPLTSGGVSWHVNANRLEVQFYLKGARPNHIYTAGAHLFATKPFTVADFLGYSLSDHSEAISREGKTAYVFAHDFGNFTTDSQGNGSKQFIGVVPAGDYSLQFTVRIGECQPSKGITKGCACVYRTGGRFSELLESISVNY